jgi:hypothetical protein
MMDTDMFLRAPVDPVALGVRRGNVVSAEYSYLYGTQSGFAKRFLERRLLGRLAQVLYSTSLEATWVGLGLGLGLGHRCSTSLESTH